jgi:hypothetical protein
MTGFITAVKIGEKTVYFNELSLKKYKTILKSLLNDPIDTDNLFLNLNCILQEITSLSKQEILELNILEYFLLLISIRQISIGNIIFATYKDEQSSMNIEIDLEKTCIEIRDCLNNFTPLEYKDDLIKLAFNIPQIKNIFQKDNNIYCNYDTDNLPIKYLPIITENVKKLFKKINTFYFFKSPIEKYSVFLTINLTDYVQLIKILFNENLLTIYNNIFYLNKICHISAEYLENCTYGEFKIFVKKVQEMQQATTQQSPNDVMNYDPVDIDSLYGNDDFTDEQPSSPDEPPQRITRSEFTP